MWDRGSCSPAPSPTGPEPLLEDSTDLSFTFQSSGPLVLSILVLTHESWAHTRAGGLCYAIPVSSMSSLGDLSMPPSPCPHGSMELPEQASETQMWPQISSRTAEVLGRGNREPLCALSPHLCPLPPLGLFSLNLRRTISPLGLCMCFTLYVAHFSPCPFASLILPDPQVLAWIPPLPGSPL